MLFRLALAPLLFWGPGLAKAQLPQTCGVGTVLDEATNQCFCEENTNDSNNNQNKEEDPNRIFLGILFDLDTFDWGRDLVEATVQFINQGFWPDLLAFSEEGTDNTNKKYLEYTLNNTACEESIAIEAYWNLRQTYGTPHGLVCARCSGASTQVARVSTLEQVPQVSPASTAASLSSKDEFPFFSRLVAPNNELGEVGALVALLRQFKWDRIAIIESETTFAKDTVKEFRKLWVGPHDDESGSWTGSIAYSTSIETVSSDTIDRDNMKQVLDNIPTDPSNNARVILLVAHSSHAFQILEQATQTSSLSSDTIWIGPSSWNGRTDPSTDFAWLPSVPGYLGVAPFQNRDDQYTRFLRELQQWQVHNSKPVTQELPPFAAETVDAIVAMAAAVAQATNPRNGSEVTDILRSLEFDGVSGPVAFTEEGDRRDPQFSVFNVQRGAMDADIPWKQVGITGTAVGMSEVDIEQLCLPDVGCNIQRLQSIPEDTYPIPPYRFPIWGSLLIAVLGVGLIVITYRYKRSKDKKRAAQAELEDFKESIVGTVVAQTNVVPQLAAAGSVGDIEEGHTEGSTSSQSDGKSATMTTPMMTGAVQKSTAQWCWKETKSYMHFHADSDVYGDPDNCWVRYDDAINTALEDAYQRDEKHLEIMSGAYKVDFRTGGMRQTKLETGFTREVQRVEEPPSEPVKTTLDLNDLHTVSSIPPTLIGEPQMVLIENDIIQITKRKDDWAFGTKLHHEDDNLARQLQSFAVVSVGSDGDPNVFTDTGWFHLGSTRPPSTDDLKTLKKITGGAGPLEAPSHWDPVVNDATVAEKYELTPGDEEYKRVVDSFMKTLSDYNITVAKVERIQNLAMYQSYIVKRSTLCYRETGHENVEDDEAQKKAIERFERSWLWHGSRVEAVDKIINQGLNRSFCGGNVGSMYGKGVYFARDARYSADPYYSKPDRNGNKYMLACRVCVGEYCEGRKNALVPDVRDPKSHSLYDSTVDNMASPSIYVTYHDAQAYPEYLITFRQ